jgi:hypothetical protein
MTLDEICAMTLDQICDGSLPSADAVLVSAGGTYYPPNTDGQGTPDAGAVSTAARFGAGNATVGQMPPGLTDAQIEQIADAVLSRSVAQVEATADPNSLCYVVLALAHADTTTHDGKLTVFQTTGAEFAQRTITSQAGAEPITGIA